MSLLTDNEEFTRNGATESAEQAAAHGGPFKMKAPSFPWLPTAESVLDLTPDPGQGQARALRG